MFWEFQVKTYPRELKIHSQHQRKDQLNLSEDQLFKINSALKKIRSIGTKHPQLALIIATLPFLILATLWYILSFLLLPALLLNLSLFSALIIYSIIRGILGYSWVIYGLHEGAGHGLLRGTRIEKLAFNSSRLLFADPENYKIVHQAHHQYLGTDKDMAFTNYILNIRILKSLLPGAGILFPNDYKIHQGDKYTRSRLVSDIIGLLFLTLEVTILNLLGVPLVWAVLALAIVAPWIGFTLDRIRESIEHHLLPASRQYGARELGLNLSGLLIGGGPWGQPFHFSHHFAPDLNWLEQILLHFGFKKILSREQKATLGFAKQNWFFYFFKTIKQNHQIERNIYEVYSR